MLTVSIHVFPVALPQLPLTHLHAFALGQSQIKYFINVPLLKALLQVLETLHTANATQTLLMKRLTAVSNRPALSFITSDIWLKLLAGDTSGCIKRAVQTNKHGVKQPAVLPRICLTIFHFKVFVWGWGLPTVTSQDEINLEKINTSCESRSVVSILDHRGKRG